MAVRDVSVRFPGGGRLETLRVDDERTTPAQILAELGMNPAESILTDRNGLSLVMDAPLSTQVPAGEPVLAAPALDVGLAA